MYILWISCFYHDSACALVKDGKILSAVQEERFTRKKHDSSFPVNSINYVLSKEWIWINDLEAIVYYEKPFIKFERLLETFFAEVPFWFKFFMSAIPVWLKEKLFLKRLLIKEFEKLTDEKIYTTSTDSGQANMTNWQVKVTDEIKSKIKFAEHHESHAYSAYFPSPFLDSAILTLDWVWEWTTTSIAHGKWHEVKILEEIKFPHSLWLFYSAFTYFLWFKVNSWEYKVMWLAPYGEAKYTKLIKENLIDIKEDWSFKLNMDYFNYTIWDTMVNKKFEKLFNKKIRNKETALTQEDMDIAASLQEVTEEIILLLAKHAKKITWSKNLCLAWWVALNCVANGKILKEKIFESIWIQPASWDAGGALWAAFAYLANKYQKKENTKDIMEWSYLWPEYSNDEVKKYLDSIWAIYEKIDNEKELLKITAENLNKWKVIWWHQWRSEFWPRSLWARSILWDPRNKTMQSTMNLKIKYRESFRPFAPSVIREDADKYFELNSDSPYMLLVALVQENIKIKMTEEQKKLFWIEKLNIIRSEIPAITHIDYSARIQTVHKETNPRYYWLLQEFKSLTWCSVLVNTSFNVRWEPIVCSPQDSYKCFMRTEMDVLVIEDFILYKEKQNKFNDKENWQEKFELD